MRGGNDRNKSVIGQDVDWGKNEMCAKNQNRGGIRNAPGTVPPPAARYASPQPAGSVAKPEVENRGGWGETV